MRGFFTTPRAIRQGSGFWEENTSRAMTAKALKRGATTVEAMAMMLMSCPGYMEAARPIPSTTKLLRKIPWMMTPTRERSFSSRGISAISTRNTADTDAMQNSSSLGLVKLESSAS